jgi:hypothetical protein
MSEELQDAVQNDHVGVVIVTTHARERFAERADIGESLEAILKRAMPFGGQAGDGILLADGDVVFATNKSWRGRVVTTVLTMDQAIANMEMVSGHRPHSAPTVLRQKQVVLPAVKENRLL